MNEPLAEAAFSPTGTPDSAFAVDVDSQGNMLRRGLGGNEIIGKLDAKGRYWFKNGQQGDYFEARNPQRDGLLDMELTNQEHPLVQALRAEERRRAMVGSESLRLRALFNRYGITGQGVKIGVLDPYEPLYIEDLRATGQNTAPLSQTWSMSDHSRAAASTIKDPVWGLAPLANVVDAGFKPNDDDVTLDRDDISSVQSNMVNTAVSLFDDTTKQLNQLTRNRPPDLKVLSLTWGASFLSALDRLKEDIELQKLNGDYLFPNVRRQLFGPALYQGPDAQEQALLNFIATTYQHPAIQQARQRYVEATRQAALSGLTVVTAVGNEHGLASGKVKLPPGVEFDELSKSPYVISVAASNTHQTPGKLDDDSIACFSSWGDGQQYNPTVAAPGQEVFINQRYDTFSSNQVESGTSFAVPFVCATIALMRQVNPNLTFAQTKAILQRTAAPLPGYPAAAQGAGVVNPEAAVQMASQLRYMYA